MTKIQRNVKKFYLESKLFNFCKKKFYIKRGFQRAYN